MRPDQEHIARELAHTLLANLDDRPAHISGRAEVHVELRGMVHGIRRQLLVDHARVALQIADEIERQTKEVDLDAIVRAAVAREVRSIRGKIDEIVHREIASAVEAQVKIATNVAAREIGQRAVDELLSARERR